MFTIVYTLDTLKETKEELPLTDYRKRMFRGAKIEDCIQDFIQMEQTTRRQMKQDQGDLAILSKGMNSAYRYVVNRMVREFEYQKEEIKLKNKLLDLEKLFRKLAENNLDQSKKDLLETVAESYFKDDIPEEALIDLQAISAENQQGIFEGMSFAYEQVANYFSVLLHSTDQISEQNVSQLLDLIANNSMMKTSSEESEDDNKTYQGGFASGTRAGFNLAILEIKETFQMHEE